jgi:aerobic-type carbon monoxide dehydrogenase small subunit (CoxS/CutS family)
MAVLELIVNGSRKRLDVDPSRTLLSVLRDELDLTGAKYGCGEGQCGACTVLLDGRPVRACLTKVAAAAQKPITTIEGLESEAGLHPLQQAFIDADAMQCGYCTPGMILEAAALLRRHAKPTDAEIARAMEGHVCRCCTYPRIAAAIRRAAATARETTAR